MAQCLPEIDARSCDGCGICVAVCPAGALELRSGRAVLARPSLCEYDGSCEPACPRSAIQLPYVVVFGPARPPPPAGAQRKGEAHGE
jgi:NAD-dependent dihydropyrimidine dehydrogenase PreA subunit